MPVPLHPIANVEARTMIRMHGRAAISILQREIDERLRAGDNDNALALDQVRREALLLLAA